MVPTRLRKSSMWLLEPPRIWSTLGPSLARRRAYADSNGSDENFTYYDAWRFRNYVIGAFNADKPFDRFLTEQLAGDLLPFRTQEERDDNIVATGFLVVGPKVIGATDKEQAAGRCDR